MTTEPRQEAEWLVDRVAGIAVVGSFGGYSEEQGERAVAYIDRMKDALAAAIEHVRANDDVPDDHSVGAWDMDADTFRALRAALSALREDET